ncbi:hypothetical protein K6Q96_20165 [Grimontia kaedaensis]|uniref:Uncharacterized protein n=1 Tax=Grimontia kaedaensis TaxID=2872157 RepID=A0ABY4X2V8_9GAMM|nr:hypothetical protein [Grimontia kaedaensis]USH05517.1 hypothetical protein K6Q96_20165 [Grimontia kaedaensis]
MTDAKGRVFTDENVAFALVGTPINTSNLPATSFNSDGSNGADFNIFALSYQTSSLGYYGAMKRMGMKTEMFSKHMMNAQVDTTPGTCDVAQLSVGVPGSHDYSFSIFGEVVEATAEYHPGGTNFVANWWSVDRKKRISALSNLVTDQTLTETAGPNVLVVAKSGTTISQLIGEAPSAFTGFSGSGSLPSCGIGNVDMVAEALGKLPR